MSILSFPDRPDTFDRIRPFNSCNIGLIFFFDFFFFHCSKVSWALDPPMTLWQVAYRRKSYLSRITRMLFLTLPKFYQFLHFSLKPCHYNPTF